MPKIGAARSVNYIGVDPGASGGVAALNSLEVRAFGMPGTERDLWELVASLGGPDSFAIIERVSGYIGEGQPGSSAFKFGMSYGLLRMALVASGTPFEEITPQKWQGALGIAPRKKGVKQLVALTKGKNKGQKRMKEVGGESPSQFKNRLKARAQQLYPSVKVTLSTADALLIATYCKRRANGTL